jgi:hypothetical protein
LLITETEEKYVKLKKNNAVYLDHFQREKVNDRLNGELREHELFVRSEREDTIKLIADIKSILNKQKKLTDKLVQSALFRKDLMIILDKVLKTKGLSANQMGEMEKELAEDMKKAENAADKIFGIIDRGIDE